MSDLPDWFPRNPYEPQSSLRYAYEHAQKDLLTLMENRLKECSTRSDTGTLPEWFPDNPYPAGATSMSDEQYIQIVPDSGVRTAISWMLYSDAYRLALKDVARAIKDRDATDDS